MFSKHLENFLLDIEIVNQKENPNEFDFVEYRIKNVVFSSKFYFKCKKYNNAFILAVSEIGIILKDHGHPVNQEIIYGFLGMFCLAKKNIRNADLIRKYFLLIYKSRLKQYLFSFIPKKESIPQLKFNDFIIGDIDYFEFKNFIENHSGSDYATLYEERFNNSFGIVVKPYSVTIINFYSWFKLLKLEREIIPKPQQEIINSYLTGLSNYYFRIFREKFKEQQQFINAYFGLHHKIDVFQYTGLHMVNFYYHIGGDRRMGWVLPFDLKLTGILLPNPTITKEVNKYLAKNNDILHSQKGEYYHFFKTYTELCSTANNHAIDKNLNESYILYYIALDFLFSNNPKGAKKFNQRISYLTCQKFSTTYNQQLDVFKDLRQKRNDLIHGGTSIGKDDLLYLMNICRIILQVLLNVHARNYQGKKLSYEDWLESIDTAIQKESHGEKLNQRQKKEIGLIDLDTLKITDSLKHYPVEGKISISFSPDATDTG